MNSCDEFIQRVEQTLPDPCTVKDLVQIGLYRSEQSAAYNRKKGNSPDYFKVHDKSIFYPKKGVIDYLEKSKHPHD